MPTYLFRNKDTQETFEKVMRIRELDEFKADHPELEQLVNGAPGLSDPVRLGLIKPSDGFRDVLKNIKNNNPGNNISVR
jgi:hypothetical protein